MKKLRKYFLSVILVIAVIWSAMTTTDYIRCRNLKEPIFVRPIIVTDSNEGVWRGVGYHIQIFRNSDGNKDVITEMTFSLFGSGLIVAELVDGQINITNCDWQLPF